MNIEIYNEWLDHQAQKSARKSLTYRQTFIGERGYPHLDGLLHPGASQLSWLRATITDTKKLAAHEFWPLIRNDKRDRKFREPPHDYVYSSSKGERDQKLFPYIKSRPIMYASHRDAAIFSVYAFALQKMYEKRLTELSLQDNVIAYRSIHGKNNVDFAKEAFDEMTKRAVYDCIMVDVKSFFDTISHSLLAERWSRLLDGGFTENPDHQVIFDRITRFRKLNFSDAIALLKSHNRRYLMPERGSLKICSIEDYNGYLKKIVSTNKTGIGIPQGSPISGVLANLYLLDFDYAMKRLVVDERNGFYRRYSDDILAICPIGDARSVYAEMKTIIGSELLKLGPKKTESFRKSSQEERLENITTMIEPAGNDKRRELQYLGFNFDGKNITIRPGTLNKHFRGTHNPSYLKSTDRKLRSSTTAKQVNKIRRVVKRD